jgi:hypothetical protein
MRNNVPDDIGIVDDIGVESPTPVHPCSPAIRRISLLAATGEEITLEQLDLLEERLLHRRGSILEYFLHSRQILDVHRRRLVFEAEACFFKAAFMCAIISSAVSKGP